ncbi:MAG: cobalamin biosynthesis protein CbiA [Thermodesulfobacteriota bacterium]|nr:cobalamin biosynthesis protein CbiA [Thermodesulfobacteriota bacterium]
MGIDLEGIVVVVGNYGSGKTEVTINLAAHRLQAGIDVRIADLDLVNPYFRSREVRGTLGQMGIEVVIPSERYVHADLPILSPKVAGMIRQPSQLTLLDVGGDEAGATVLSSLFEPLHEQPVQMLQVVNPYRPYTDTIEGCLKIRERIEYAARMTITGLVGNANLIDETTLDDIIKGYAFVRKLSMESDLPLMFITAEKRHLEEVDPGRFSCPFLPIHRQLVPPWRSPVGFQSHMQTIVRS